MKQSDRSDCESNRRTMAQLRWIQGFLLMISQLTVTAERKSVLKRAGDDVMLSCSTVIDGQQKCNGTTWIFAGLGNRATVESVNLGQIGSSKPDRSSLTENCSSVIKKVREEDVGLYYCQQWKQGDKQGGHIQVCNSSSDSSVIYLTKHEKSQEVTLNCSVVTSDLCSYKVKWFYQDVNNRGRTSETGCSATVTLSSGSKLPQCKVTHIVTDEEFTFSSQSSGQKPESSESKAGPTKQPGKINSQKTTPKQKKLSPTLKENSGSKTGPTKQPGKINSEKTKPKNKKVSTTLKENSGSKIGPTVQPGKINSEKTTPKQKNVSPTLKENSGSKAGPTKQPGKINLEKTTPKKSKVSLSGNPATTKSTHSSRVSATSFITTTKKPKISSQNQAAFITAAVVVSAIILVAAVMIIRWRAKEKKKQADESPVELDDVYYSTIRHPEETRRNPHVGVKHDAVTYSTVRACSSSAAASDDPNNLYSVITSIK